ncbi:anti-sigma factor [Amycolatopsis samaneae]|uniref:Regulator of SigK n=1 Tax=Amycolatopsis samaneae TaxID=664691 RepID=A0ABW5G6Z6_9PSEU
MDAEIHVLTGAYALDAVSDLERAAFERHLADCATCTQEVRELRETAARLGAASVIVPPPRLRESVLAEVAGTRQRPPAVGDGARRRRWPRGLAIAVAGVAAAAALVVGVLTAGLGRTPDAGHRQEAAINAVLTAPDAVTVSAPAPNGTTVVRSRAQGKIVLFPRGFPALDPAHAYQVWLIGPDGPYSAGLLPSEVDKQARPLLAELPRGADRVGVTVEPAGGSPRPTTPAVTMLTLS